MNGQHDNTTIYSAADILRYLNGSMDRRELHALERAMLDDEMLADSVEGYKLMRETLSEEAILGKAEQLATPQKKESGEAKVAGISGFRWLSYAIAASMVIAGGWWIFSITGPNNALPGETLDQNQPALVNTGPVDTFVSGKRETMSETPGKAEPKPGEIVSAQKSGNQQKTSANKIAEPAEINTNQPAAPLSIVPPANELAKADENVAKEADTRVRKQKIAPSTIAGEKPSTDFNITDSSAAAPLNGWNSYSSYLAKTLYLTHIDQPGIIEIALDAAGKVTGVRVESSLEEQQKASIIQAIQTGPSWKNKTRKPAKATIQFQ